MPTSLQDRLLQKGWSQEDIDRTHEILYSDEKIEKHYSYREASHPIMYWASLIVAIIANLLIAVVFVPFLMVLDNSQLYIIIGIVGVAFGGMFKVLIEDIEHINQQHHIVAGVFIPAVGLITIYMMTSLANRFTELIHATNTHSATILSIVYFMCFSAPYTLYKIKDLIQNKKPN